ncbi:MAG: hypothetical protein J5504_04015 [Butyrivibrio sp.]|nr:hypothetical protein [Butyrivibrio sp.]
MDKVEYKIRADEIKALIGEGRFAEAVKIADTIDWKRVKSVAMLCTISDLYKINRRFEESRDILLMAYDRHPTGRAIVYSLCELAIKMGEFVQAVEYYKEFVRIAPRDTGRYILQYKLYEAQEVSLEERIAVLEEFKKHDYREKWVYELAYLYHRIGLTTECIETCDEMFLWLGDGNYVMKALELKALHEPLSPEQQDRYIRYKQKHGGYIDRSITYNKEEPAQNQLAQALPGTQVYGQDTREMQPVSNDVEIKAPSVDVSAYNTMNLQAALAEELKPYIGGNEQTQPQASFAQQQADAAQYQTNYAQQTGYAQQQPGFAQYQQGYGQQADAAQYQQGYGQQADAAQYQQGFAQQQEAAQYQQSFAQQAEAAQYQQGLIPQQDPTQYQQDVAQQEVAPYQESFAQQQEAQQQSEFAQYQEEMAQQQSVNAQANSFDAQQAYGNATFAEEMADSSEPEILDEDENDSSFSRVSGAIGEPTPGGIEEVFFDTHEIHVPEQEPVFKPAPEYKEEAPAQEPVSDISEVAQEEVSEFFDLEDVPDTQPSFSATYENRPLEDEVPGAVIHPNGSYSMANVSTTANANANVDSNDAGLDNVLSQDYDGQIKMAVEPEPEVEKQITGQISISEYIQNWEQFKKDQQERQLESVKKKVSDQTGDLFADYDEITKAGLQEKIEKAIADAIKKEKQKRASGRGDWSRNNADIIDEAVDEVINNAEQGDADSSLEDMDKEEPAKEPEKKKDRFAREDFGASKNDVKAEESKEADPKEEEQEEEETRRPQNRYRRQGGQRPERPERAERTERSDVKNSDNQDSSQGAKKKLKKHNGGNREIEERLRKMTPEEKKLFGPYIHHKKSRRQIIKAIDNMSMDAFSGNVIVTGEEGAGTVELAKGLIRVVQASNSTFNGKVAKITANMLNKKRPSAILEKLANGALIVRRAADIMPETAAELIKILKEEKKGIIIVMEDTKEDINEFLDSNPDFKESFSVRVDIEALDDESLVAYAKQYALEKEYAIDNLGILALHTMISERQTLDHDVTISEVRDIVDDAIDYAEKRSVSHFVDIIVRKRYDENDMIILREKDFMH